MYDVIVVGGGHAGIEASLAPSRMGLKTLLVTSNINNIGSMPCNTSIGGPAKGIIVREIDALGGQMSKTADKTYLQMKMLNTAKGPGVQSLRAQADKKAYPRYMQKVVKEQENLDLIEGMVEDLVVEDQTVKGVILDDGTTYLSKTVILTTGTYLKAEILVGHSKHASGPDQQKESKFLSGKLKDYGFRIQRLKTGTPPRIEKSTIDFTKTKVEDGDQEPYTFEINGMPKYDVNNQIPCHLIYTNKKTHDIILSNLDKSAMYGGYIKDAVGPRYCPSIEDKLVKFKDKERHQLFLEPESLYYDDIYIQGFSTSMPTSVQEEMVHSLEGLENAKILKYAYAIEYDAIYPTQLKQSLETKVITNLFTAGQINGTSGYEEAACQGLIAGINASLKLENKEPLILKRNEAYIGVLIDDLITKGTNEPYRLLTSRAEYRLLLRHDNADLRLREYGYQIGLIDEETYQKFKEKKQNIQKLLNYFKETKIKLENKSDTIYNALKNPEININNLIDKYNIKLNYDKYVIEQVEIQIKYEGYIRKTEKEAEKMLKYEEKQIPSDIDYNKVPNLATEARQKLIKYAPTSIGMALRISGVNPADISILMVYLKKKYNE